MDEIKKMLTVVVKGQASLEQELQGMKEEQSDMRGELRAVMNGQSAMKHELKSDIGQLREDVKRLDVRVDKLDVKLTKRIDKIGLQMAELEDDAPTREEFDGLEERVGRLKS